MTKKLFLLLTLAVNSIYSFAQYDCVYTAGFTRDANNRWYAAYWKSGQITKLTNGTNDDEARTIAVSGNDVHVGGFKTIGGQRVAAYWRNGREVPLNLVGDYSRIPSAVYAIKTVGNDVYMFVTQPRKLNYNDPNNYYYYYKNGARQTMTLTPGQVVNEVLTNSESYFVTPSGDIYIANPTLTDGKVTYWKNGTRIASTQDYSRLYLINLCSILVTDNGDVYIAGTKSPTSSSSKAAYWKNSNEVGISVDSWSTYATGIYVENGNVYISGYESRTFAQLSALYWKNGYKTRLHDYDTDHYDAITKAIAVVNGNVYVAGSHKSWLYWVNGKEAKLDQGGETYAMTVVKGGGCFNSTQASTTGTANYQSSARTGQAAPSQQQPLAEDIRQLATGVSGLMATIRAERERKAAEEKQAAIEKSKADRQRSTDAESGVYKAQVEMAEKYFSDSKYDLAENFYLRAFENPNASVDERDRIVGELMCTLALQEKKKELFEIFKYLTNQKTKNYYVSRLLTLLKIHCNDFGAEYLDCSDSLKQDGIDEMKKLLSLRNDANALYAYFQTTGSHEKYGIPKNEKEGLKTLEDFIDEKYGSYKSNACYYMGMIYLNGTGTIKVNEKKALNYFKKGYYGKEKNYHLVPAYSAYKAGKVYFNYDLLNYIKIAIIYSKSEDQENQVLGQKMLRAFYKYYKGMIPASDMEYFKPFIG